MCRRHCLSPHHAPSAAHYHHRPLPRPDPRPQVLTNLKYGWIQFLITLITIQWLFSWCEYFIFHYRLLHTRVVSDLQPRAQRF